ncbi:DUF5700 domain-containing putative Zn-dependent protease [Caldithrix abyssi]
MSISKMFKPVGYYKYFTVLICWMLLPAQNVLGEVLPAKGEQPLQTDWRWEQLIARAQQKETLARIYELKTLLSQEEAHFLLRQLHRLAAPRDLRRLSELEREQAQHGGGFFGIVPDYFADPDSIPFPDNFDHLIETALYLAQIRQQNRQIVSNPAFQFPLAFRGEPLPPVEGKSGRSNLQLYFDFSAIEAVLHLFALPEISFQQARQVAEQKTFREMLLHRRNLGYLPEPLPDSKDLAQFIFRAASRDPVAEIWKWLNPWNNFGLADLYCQQEDYRRLISYWKANRAQLETLLVRRLARCAPADIQFSDTVSFAVNFGIRSWATSSSLGTNLIQFKDHYPLMLRTIAHESFHRLQLQICPVPSSRKKKKTREFEDLVASDFPEEADRKFYQALSYIMLEGTATYVGGVDSSWVPPAKIRAGRALLEEVVTALYQEKDFDRYEALINQGLKSNGPFYALGYAMSQAIAARYGSEKLGRLLQQGSLAFFNEYLQVLSEQQTNPELRFFREFAARLHGLQRQM